MGGLMGVFIIPFAVFGLLFLIFNGWDEGNYGQMFAYSIPFVLFGAVYLLVMFASRNVNG